MKRRKITDFFGSKLTKVAETTTITPAHNEPSEEPEVEFLTVAAPTSPSAATSNVMSLTPADNEPSELEEPAVELLISPTTVSAPTSVRPSAATSNVTSLAEVHCSSECCRDLSKSSQPDDPAVLAGTKRVQGEGTSQRNRSVQPQWFKDHRWLTRAKPFCTQCRFWTMKGLGSGLSKTNENAFSVLGFQNWKNAAHSFRKHESSKYHREAMAYYQLHVSQQPSIAAQLDTQLKAKQKLRREMLVKEITSIMYLMGQGIALDGHDPQNSNLYKLLQLRAQDCPEIDQWLAEKNYMSHDIINELIHLISRCVLGQVISPIRDEFYALLADETRDISTKEQLVSLFRWVDDSYVVHEDFIGLFDLPKADASTIVTALNDILIRCNILPSMCRGQAYDGAASMSGHLNGVAATFKRSNPAAIYVHCFAHCLNLCLQDTGKQCKAIRDALDLVQEVTHLVKQSPKQNHTFQVLKNEMGPGNHNLRTLCPTRWTVRTGAVKSIIDNYAVLSSLMTQLNEESHDETGRKAGGILAVLDKFSTFFGLHLAFMCFSPIEQLSRTLQTVNISLEDAQKAVAVTRSFIQRKRSDNAFNDFYKTVVQDSKDLTDAPVLPRQQKRPKKLDTGEAAHTFQSPVNHYRRLYFEVLDLLDGEMDRRFEQRDLHVAADLERLIVSAAKGEIGSFPSSTVSLYEKDFDFDSLRAQLNMLPDAIRTSGITVTTVASVTSAMNAAPVAKTLLPDVHRLLKLFYTIPVSTASAERSFSTLRRMKTYLRSTMTQRRLNDLMCSHTHRDALANVDGLAIASDFIQHNERRRNFFGNV